MFSMCGIHKYGQVDKGLLYSEFVQKIKGIKSYSILFKSSLACR